ncbi:MAG: LamG domain-containing protein [Nanoarchaeota archaeon]|nr:LamG domain-containing protein [Nanoarchaeota archaeon]
MFNKKSQSAMEYLMTYGWAILIILIAIGALFYLGVFSPSTPSVCQVQAPFVCSDFIVGSNALLYDLGFNEVSSAEVTGVVINGGDCDNYPEAYYYNPDISSGGNKKMVGCVGDLSKGDYGISEGDKISSSFGVSYSSTFGLDHNIDGQGSGTVEAGEVEIPGLVAYYPFSEGEGLTTVDFSGNGYDGQITDVGASSIWGVGSVKPDSNYLNFVEDGDYVVVDAAGKDKLNNLADNGFTVTVWVNKNGGNDGYEMFVVKTNGAVGVSTFLLRQGTPANNYPEFVVSDGTIFKTVILPDLVMSTGNWYFIAGVFEGDKITIYGNLKGQGTLITALLSLTGTGFTTLNENSEIDLWFGDRVGAPLSQHLDGKLDDVAIYDHALTGEELLAIFQSYSPSG